MIKQITPEADIIGLMDTILEKNTKLIVSSFQYVGEQCVKEARENGSYKDQTGNLRSSIGYFVLLDGRIVESGGFKKVLHGSEGTEAGKEFINNALQNASQEGISLIVVAGMNYAEAVESLGYDVLTSGELLAEKLVPTLMKQLGFKAA